jgi:hypothetical protein
MDFLWDVQINNTTTLALWNHYYLLLSDNWVSIIYSVDNLDKGMNHMLGGKKQNGTRFYPAPQNNGQFKTYGLFMLNSI